MTEKGRLTTSRLLVQKAIQSDSGSYTCAPSNANPISVRVHILNGKFIISYFSLFFFSDVLFEFLSTFYFYRNPLSIEINKDFFKKNILQKKKNTQKYLS